MVVDALSWVGKTLAGGRYRVTALLGEGGMGAVYRAHDAHLDTEVVIKVPKAGLLADQNFAARFGREVRSLVRLAHAHIVRVLDVGEYQGLPFAVMQFLVGGSLRERLDCNSGAGTAAALADLASWLPGVADALDYIHRQGYVHRDVKPDNILFDATGHVYLGDFGIAKALADAEGARTTAFRTVAGLVIGTPQYMAPELAVGGAVSGAADQYALAVTAYEAVCGRLPFDGATEVTLAVQHATRPAPPPHEVTAGVPLALSAALLRGLCKEPAGRFPDCRSLAQALLVPLQALAAPHPATAREAPQVVPAKAPMPVSAVPAAGPEHRCPSCGAVFRLPPLPEGKQLRCRYCGANFKVPATLPGSRADTDALASAKVETAERVPLVSPLPSPRPQGYPCPSCGKVFAAPAHLRGKRVHCKRCQARFVLPPAVPASPSAGAPGPTGDRGPRPKAGKARFSPTLRLVLACAATAIVVLAGVGVYWRFFSSSRTADDLGYRPRDRQAIAAVPVDRRPTRSKKAAPTVEKGNEEKVLPDRRPRRPRPRPAPDLDLEKSKEEVVPPDLAPEKSNEGMLPPDLDQASEAEALLERGKSHLDRKEYASACDAFRRACALDPANSEGYCYLGEGLLLMGNYREAIENFTQALDLEADYVDALVGRGDAHRLLGEYDAAIEDCDKALGIDEGSAWAYGTRGAAYHARGVGSDFELALNDLNKAIELDDQYTFAFRERCLLREAMGLVLQQVDPVSAQAAFDLAKDDYATADRLEGK
jgi:serine/threonine protein kinase